MNPVEPIAAALPPLVLALIGYLTVWLRRRTKETESARALNREDHAIVKEHLLTLHGKVDDQGRTLTKVSSDVGRLSKRVTGIEKKLPSA